MEIHSRLLIKEFKLARPLRKCKTQVEARCNLAPNSRMQTPTDKAAEQHAVKLNEAANAAAALRRQQVSRPVAAVIASCAFAVPLALSISSSPSPRHPRTFAWYRSLREPSFKPPDWVFPIAWTTIQSGLATAAYRLLRAPNSVARTNALALWGWNVLMIGGWSRLFFKRHKLAASTIAAGSMVATSAMFVKEAKRVDSTAANAGVPLVGWLTFATVLTTSIWWLNRRR